MKSITIPGVSGKKISIDELTLGLFSMAATAKGTCWVTAKAGSQTTEIARWSTSSITSVAMSATPAFVGNVGEDVTIEWRLLTSLASVRVKINNLTYSYTTIDGGVVDVPECLVVVECETQEEATAIATSLADQGANVYTRKAN
ncbi:MAG: hypothetical protein PHU69_05640 [Fermentimonas sp.]|nr:hypothetical protein [Fermentimonas sp.]